VPISTDLDKVRLRIGDTDSTDQLLSDDEVNYFISIHSDLDVAAAACCEAIAALFARGYNFTTDGQSFNRSERVQHYMDLADRLDPSNSRSGAGTIVTVATTKVDGYSDDVDYQEGSGQGVQNGRVRVGYWNPDLPL
jgi:hypothetical protein